MRSQGKLRFVARGRALLTMSFPKLVLQRIARHLNTEAQGPLP